MAEWITPLDNLVSSWVVAVRNPGLTRFFQTVTHLGSVFGIILVSLIMLGYFGFRKKWAQFKIFFFTVSLGEVMNETLKWAFHRERPPFPWLTEAAGYSFPSGHTLLSTITYGIIAYLLFIKESRRPFRPMTALLVIIPVLVGLSRVYLGVHFITDVLGGWILGILWLALAARFVAKR